ncbi:MAG: hypothetical protein WCI37_02035, partial [bacterium]
RLGIKNNTLYNIHNVITHIQNYEIREHRIPNFVTFNRNLRVSYILNKITEDEVEEEWFSLLSDSMSFLDDFSINLDLVRVWFYLSVFMIMGNTPNLSKDSLGNEFKEKQEYDFDLETMSFTPKEKGSYVANHIKILKLANQFQPTKMVNIQNCEKLSNDLYPLIRSIAKTNLDI